MSINSSHSGEYFPSPIIQSVMIGDDSITVSISVFVDINNNLTEEQINKSIDALASMNNFYVYLTLHKDRLQNIIEGNVNVLEYTMLDDISYDLDYYNTTTKSYNDFESSVSNRDFYFAVGNIFSYYSDTDGNRTYTYLINKEQSDSVATPVWEFRIEKEISIGEGFGSTDQNINPSDLSSLYGNHLTNLWAKYWSLYYITQDRGVKYNITPEGYIDSDILSFDYSSLQDEADAYFNTITSADSSSWSENRYYQYYVMQNFNIGLHIGTFCTTLDLNNEEELSDALNNKVFLNMITGEVCYQTVFDELMPDWFYSETDDGQKIPGSGYYQSFSEVLSSQVLAAQKQLEFMTSTDTIYGDMPVQSINNTYYDQTYISQEKIIDDFQKLLDSTLVVNRPQVSNMVNQIKYLLETHSSETDLLPQLNSLKSVFPNKSSATPVGQLYSNFKKVLYTVNSRLTKGSILTKKVTRNPILKDYRTTIEVEYAPPSYAMDDAKLATKGEEFIYTDMFKTFGEYDDFINLYTVYGFFFFDYEKALGKASTLAQAYDFSKLRNILSLDIAYKYFYMTEAVLVRSGADAEDAFSTYDTVTITSHLIDNQNCEDGICSDVEAETMADAAPTYPRTYWVMTVDSLSAGDQACVCYPENEDGGSFATALTYEEVFGLIDPDSGASFTEEDFYTTYGGYPDDVYYSEVTGPAGASTAYGFGTTDEYPLLVLRGLARRTGIEGSDSWLPPEYRLAMFEFQDYYRDLCHSGGYDVKIKLADSTKLIHDEIVQAYQDQLDLFADYIETVNTVCSFNNITDQFNEFFINGMSEFYAGAENTAPWNTAPAIFIMYRDVFYDEFDGDSDKMTEAIVDLTNKISPSHGTLAQIQLFYERMQALYDRLWDPSNGEITSILNSYSDEREITITSGWLTNGAYLGTETYFTTNLECDESADPDLCPSGEKCESGICIEDVPDEDTAAGCTEASDCGTGMKCSEGVCVSAAETGGGEDTGKGDSAAGVDADTGDDGGKSASDPSTY